MLIGYARIYEDTMSGTQKCEGLVRLIHAQPLSDTAVAWEVH